MRPISFAMILAITALTIPGPAAAGWAGGDPSLELDTARTLPLSHVSVHVLRSSRLGLTDRMQVSSHLLQDLSGSPNLMLRWSFWQWPTSAVAIELGTGVDSGLVTLAPVLKIDDEPAIKPYLLVGAVGTWSPYGRIHLTGRLRYAYHLQGGRIGTAESGDGFHQVMPGASLIVPVAAQTALWIEAQAFVIGERASEGLLPFGAPDDGSSFTAGFWIAHAFEHLRVQVGGVLPPGGRVLPTRLETWPVLPAVELSWDFMLR